MKRVLIIDDDLELCELLAEYLEAEGFACRAVHDGESGVAAARVGEFDLLVLDVMLPRLNGFEVLQRIRASSDQGPPVLMLTARGDDVDRIVGLEMGADDYLAKPCNPRELVARLRAILRRTAAAVRPAAEGERPAVLVVGDVTLDPGSRTVTRGDEPIALTGAELKVLEVLLAAAGRVVGKAELSRSALARRPTPFDRSIDVHVSRIRKKLGERPGGGPRIESVRGEGYQYLLPAEDRQR